MLLLLLLVGSNELSGDDLSCCDRLARSNTNETT
jgi:hypothetical protein